MKRTLTLAEKTADRCSVQINKRIAELLEKTLADGLLDFDEVNKVEAEVVKLINQCMKVIAREALIRECWDAQKRYRFSKIYPDEDTFLDGVFPGSALLRELVEKNFELWEEKVAEVQKKPGLSKEDRTNAIKALTGRIGESGLTYAMMRILRTETNKTVNNAAKKAAEGCMLLGYEYHAILDDKLCERCHHLDGMLFSWKDAKTGVNLPPLHPNCRCYTTHTAVVLNGMSFEDWREKYVSVKKK